MKRAPSRKTIYVTLFVLAIVGIASADDPTPVTACGTVITVAGKYRLANDLVGCSSFGVQINSNNVTLLLNGHTISGPGPATNTAGVALYGVSGPANLSVLGPGLITNFTTGVFVNTGPCVIANVTVTQSGDGFGVFGGFENNVFKGNTANGNTGRGFIINGDSNIVKGNDSSNNGIGFLVAGSTNEVRGNTANANSQDGIQVFCCSGNTIRGNTALGNNTTGGTFYDLEDDNANCDSNLWQGNDFGTANESCI